MLNSLSARLHNQRAGQIFLFDRPEQNRSGFLLLTKPFFGYKLLSQLKSNFLFIR